MLAAVDLIHRRDVVPKTAFESSYSRNRTLFDPLPNQSGGVGFDIVRPELRLLKQMPSRVAAQRLFLRLLSLAWGV